jgi:hypothetical protein
VRLSPGKELFGGDNPGIWDERQAADPMGLQDDLVQLSAPVNAKEEDKFKAVSPEITPASRAWSLSMDTKTDIRSLLGLCRICGLDF